MPDQITAALADMERVARNNEADARLARAREEAGVVAGILLRGYREHIRIHGPDADYAGHVMETMGGSAFIVARDGRHNAVTVSEQGPDGPLMQGDWL